jgi:AcrR family transcriptional regulator
VTIRRLAADNSVTPMALYWHFADKDAVIDGIAEQIFSNIAAPAPGTGTWAEELRAELDALLVAVRPHPLVADILAPRVMRSEPGLALAERVIGLLRRAGFSSAGAAQTASFLLSSIVTLVTSEPGSKVIAGEDPDVAVRSKRAELDALDPKLFPNLLDCTDYFLSSCDEEDYFGQGMDFLVAGTVGILRA